MTLVLKPNTNAPDEIYEAIIRMHEGLSDKQSKIVNARMILLLANHIGDPSVIREAAHIARSEGKQAPASNAADAAH